MKSSSPILAFFSIWVGWVFCFLFEIYLYLVSWYLVFGFSLVFGTCFLVIWFLYLGLCSSFIQIEYIAKFTIDNLHIRQRKGTESTID
jgi:hypothetical protein